MILQYFTKKENIEKDIAEDTYKIILKESNLFIQKNNFFIKKDYNSSFEIVSIFIIIFIQLNIYYKPKNHKKINEKLISFFISDLDESLRVKGIGDMSIGKYVKSYVKKFYYRLSNFPKNFQFDKESLLIDYLNKFDLIKKDQLFIASKKFEYIYHNLKKSYYS